jgi:hypothetical protein
VDPNLPKDRFDMNLRCGLGDGQLTRYALVGITLNQTAQDGLLPSRQRCEASHGAWYKFIRFTFGPDHLTIITILIRVSVIRDIYVMNCVAAVAGCAAAVLPMTNET